MFKTYSKKWGAMAHRRALEGDGSFLKCCGNGATALNIRNCVLLWILRYIDCSSRKLFLVGPS